MDIDQAIFILLILILLFLIIIHHESEKYKTLFDNLRRLIIHLESDHHHIFMILKEVSEGITPIMCKEGDYYMYAPNNNEYPTYKRVLFEELQKNKEESAD